MIDPEQLLTILRGPYRAAVCTVVSTTGSTPRKAGTSMVVCADGSALGQILGTIGGGAVEHRLREVALEVIACTQPRMLEIALSKQLGMCCGGTMLFFVEALRSNPPLVLFGAGHVAQALCVVATQAGFDVTVCDPREEQLGHVSFVDATQRVDDYAVADFADLPFGPDAFVVVATHDHATDQELVVRVMQHEFRYLGLVGSQRKAMLTRDRCINRGIAADMVARLRCPAGLAIGAQTPQEIAVSIVAEMVQVRRVDAAGTAVRSDRDAVVLTRRVPR